MNKAFVWLVVTGAGSVVGVFVGMAVANSAL